MTTLIPDTIDIALQSQRDQHARVTQLAAEANERIDQLDKTAPPEVREKQFRQIRSKTEQASQRIRAEMAQRARSARQQLSRQRFAAGTDGERVTRPLHEIDALEAQASLTLTEAVTGNSNPIERLKVARRMAALR